MALRKTILIVEDEKPIREMVSFALGRAGYDLVEAGDVTEAFEQMSQKLPDLVLLDWMLPGASGIEFARRMKRDELTRDVPIVMLTARGEEEDKVSGLEAGADDYITKPFSPRELMARIKAVLRRRAPQMTVDCVEVEGLRIDPVTHRVTGNGKPIDLGPTEFRLLHFFMTHAERVHTRAQLLDQVWGDHIFVEERTVDVHIRRLRASLEATGHDRLIQTVRGTGYRFSAQSE